MRWVIKNWWSALAVREQKILIGGAIIAVLLLFYLLIWQPLTGEISSTKRIVQHNSKLIIWMQHATKRIIVLRKSGVKTGGIGSESLLTFLDSSTRKHNLHCFITKLQQANNNQVNLLFNKAPFDKLITWLTAIWQQDGIKITQAAIQPAKKSGTVTSSFQLALSS